VSENPELFEYIGFFEVEPAILHPDLGWPYGAKFVSTRGAERIEATIAPDEGEFSFVWWREEQLQADLRLVGIVGWALECRPAAETLTLKFAAPAIVYFRLQLKPHVSIAWRTWWDHAST